MSLSAKRIGFKPLSKSNGVRSDRGDVTFKRAKRARVEKKGEHQADLLDGDQ